MRVRPHARRLIVPVVVSSEGRQVKTYAMLDDGSTKVVISERLASKLALPRTPKLMHLHTVEGASHRMRDMADFTISNLHGDLSFPVSQALVTDFLATEEDMPPRNDEISGMEYLDGVSFQELDSDDVDIILSIDYGWTWLGGEVRRSTPDKPLCLLTKWGWTLASARNGAAGDKSSCFRTAVEIDNKELHELVERLFRQDFPDIPVNQKHDSLDDEHAMKQLKETIRFDETLGHYKVGLPWVTSREEAAKRLNPINSSDHALNRLKKSMAKIKAGHPDQLKYVKAQMQSMYDDDHAEFIDDDDTPVGCPSWVLPLHIVFQPNKPTKPRCCHDGRSTLKGTCLNDQLLTGPDLLNDLLGVIFRFRLKKVTLSADIKGFFHQVYVDDRDAHVFKFWWYDDEDCTHPKLSMLKVHVFGAKSSPTVCAFTLRHHGEMMKGQISPEVAEAIIKSFYVDDFLASYDDVATARRVRKELTEVMKKGGFELLKWNSSHPAVLDDEPNAEDDTWDMRDATDSNTNEKILGVKYSFRTDEFFFGVKPEKVLGLVSTRRQMLKCIASCFDPLGLIAPFLLKGRLMFQVAIRDKTRGWDDELPEELIKEFKKWQLEISELSEFRIPRWTSSEATSGVAPQLHLFSDSSKSAYGFCGYRRAQKGSTVDLRFLFAKSRVIPAEAEKTRHHNSIPRFELTACKVSADFYEKYERLAGESYERVFFWTDSQCALGQIHDRKLRHETFVANRLSIIKAKTNVRDWHYVNTKDNPADITSRGLNGKDKEWDMFHFGPTFLRSPDWTPPPQAEIASIALTAGEEEEALPPPPPPPISWALVLAERSNSWVKKTRLLARVAQCIRIWRAKTRRGAAGVVTRSRAKSAVVEDPTLSIDMVRKAEVVILREIQRKHFEKEMNFLIDNRVCDPNSRQEIKLRTSKLKKLNCFLDKDGLIRSGTRLLNAESLTFNSRCPIVLPKDDAHVSALIHTHHVTHGHAGAAQTKNALRKRFMIISDGQAVRTVIHRCVKCQRNFKAPAHQQMAPLPVDRLEPGHAFEVTGVDLFGPYDLKNRRQKKKTWVVLFTCVKTRAVHFEMVESLSSPAFINALIRFQARRPGVKKLFSDCGSNFVGSAKMMESAVNGLATAGESATAPIAALEWCFLPPHAAHRGGIWERLVGMTKRILASLLGKGDVDTDVFRTVIAQAEFILNSRPLTHLSADPMDMEPLTPLHLLHPGVDVSADASMARFGGATAEECRFAHQRSIHLVKGFWKRWVNEYVATLKVRSKWEHTQPDLKVGQLVLLVDELKARNEWKLGRITGVDGGDGRVRTLTLSVGPNQRVFKRDVTKVVALELA